MTSRTLIDLYDIGSFFFRPYSFNNNKDRGRNRPTDILYTSKLKSLAQSGIKVALLSLKVRLTRRASELHARNLSQFLKNFGVNTKSAKASMRGERDTVFKRAVIIVQFQQSCQLLCWCLAGWHSQQVMSLVTMYFL